VGRLNFHPGPDLKRPFPWPQGSRN
jgi:hypothetical protein